MIKKISQLNELPISAYNDDFWTQNHGFDEDKKAEARRKADEMMFEVSYETETPTDKNDEADEVNYYTSYSINLSGMKDALTITDVWEVLSVLSSGGLSVISGNLIIGTPNLPMLTDKLPHEVSTDNIHNLTIYDRTNLNNHLTCHGTANFHNDVNFLGDHAEFHCEASAVFDQLIMGVAYRAKWGDLAEYYLADENYEPGTLVKFGGEKEITIATDKVNGVVTTQPGIVLNGKDENETSVGVALVGRVPVKVRGPVRKFDKIVLSHTDPGIGVVYNFAYSNDVIARALEDNQDPEDKLVMCATKFNLI